MKSILSFGGGVNSTALLVYLIKNNFPLDLVVFSDTGDEHHHTYVSVEYYAKWTEKQGIKFMIANGNEFYGTKTMYDYFYNKKITPSRIKRDCTGKFKVAPLRRMIKKIFPQETFMMYLGIDFGEFHRMKQSNVKYISNSYPLVDAQIDRQGCKSFLIKNNLPVPEKSGCWYCPYTKRSRWIEMLHTDPDLFKKAKKLEMNNRRYPENVSWLGSISLKDLEHKYTGQRSLLQWSEKNEIEETDENEKEMNCDVSGSCFL